MTKRMLEEKENEIECLECASIVQVNWGESPNVHCENCKLNYDVSQCEICTNLMQVGPDEEFTVCSDCIEYAVRD